MDDVKCYLLLNFSNAALIIKNDYLCSKKNPTYVKPSRYDTNVSVYEEPDLKSPIGISQLTNALHVMCNLPPVPLKRKEESAFTWNDELVKMAENSFIRYDNLPYCRIRRRIKTKKGDIIDKYTYFGDMFKSVKSHHNSDKRKTTIIDGVKYEGYYDWGIFYSYFRGKLEKEWKELIMFFNSTLGCDDVISHYKFCDFVSEFHKHLFEPKVINFIEKRYQELKNIKVKDGIHRCSYYTLNGCNHLKIVFNEGNTASDNTAHGHHPLFTRSSVDFLKLKYKGSIIIPIYNEKVLRQMENVGITPNILDGGLVSIVGLQKSIPEFVLESEYTKITEQNMLQTLEIQ